MSQVSYEQLALAEVQRRDTTDYRFNYWSYLGWTILTFGTYSVLRAPTSSSTGATCTRSEARVPVVPVARAERAGGGARQEGRGRGGARQPVADLSADGSVRAPQQARAGAVDASALGVSVRRRVHQPLPEQGSPLLRRMGIVVRGERRVGHEPAGLSRRSCPSGASRSAIAVPGSTCCSSIITGGIFSMYWRAYTV